MERKEDLGKGLVASEIAMAIMSSAYRCVAGAKLSCRTGCRKATTQRPEGPRQGPQKKPSCTTLASTLKIQHTIRHSQVVALRAHYVQCPCNET